MISSSSVKADTITAVSMGCVMYGIFVPFLKAPLWALSANAAASPIIGLTPSVIALFIFLMYLSL